MVYEYNPRGERWIFIDELPPNHTRHELTGEWGLRDSATNIDVLTFDVSYFREAIFTASFSPRKRVSTYAR